MNNGFDLMITIIPVIAAVGFIIVIGTIVYKRSIKDSASTSIVSKQTDVQQNPHNHDD
ncbi:DUF2500 domain-containing protein [Paenibacillus lupini]|uniref:DUF2500 domain-containing protein n=1 Tax=Paenibacillus lupini TaxID=1450204 RepID=UPI00141F88B9|nr:DUF2500 domain-containing protein [Paenibacillus lupini]NIK26249.1 hypothetical protein [Paenibacillus lupini]